MQKPCFRPIVPSHWQTHKNFKFSAFGPRQLLYDVIHDILCFVFVILRGRWSDLVWYFGLRLKSETLVSVKNKVTHCLKVPSSCSLHSCIMWQWLPLMSALCCQTWNITLQFTVVIIWFWICYHYEDWFLCELLACVLISCCLPYCFLYFSTLCNTCFASAGHQFCRFLIVALTTW